MNAATKILAAVLGGIASMPAGAATYYVDFDQGQDDRAGTSPAQAFRP